MKMWLARWVDSHWNTVRMAWLRRDVRDGAILIAIVSIAYPVAHIFDLPRRLLTLALSYQHLDDFLFVGFIVSVIGPIYGIRRYRDFTREMMWRLRAERAARMLTGQDHLTGLPNGRFFAQRLDEHLGAMSEGEGVATLVIVIRGCKRVFDLHGHGAGERMIIDFAGRIAALLREGSVLARTGGDAFAIAMPKIISLDEPAGLAHRIVLAMSEAFLIDDAAVSVGVSIGIAVAPSDGMTSMVLIQRAERALYRGAAEDPSPIRFFESEMDAHIDQRILMEGRLRKAVKCDAIIPHYQPLASLDDNRIVGFEALARWNDDVLGEVSPDAFIPLAEEIGLIGMLGDQLFRHACADASEWPDDLFMAFNVSAIQLTDPSLAPRILAVLAEHRLSPLRLEIEITESAMVERVDDARFAMDQLREKGVHIVLDDFGTGYATLAQLLAFPLDKIKIDRRFVTNVVTDHDSLVVIRAIVGLARGFGLTSVAEGIENPEQLNCLKRNGCAQGQGYWFGRAVPAAAIPALLLKSVSMPVQRDRGETKGEAGTAVDFR
jgi:diguanylate cyclase (GGDEF)-like protein